MSRQQGGDLVEVQVVEVISWAIRRIVGGHYALSDDERGRELWVNEFDPTLDEMEGVLCSGPDDRAREPLRLLKEDCTHANVRYFYDVILGEKLGGMLAGQFSGRQLSPVDYPVVVAIGYRQLMSLVGDSQRLLTNERERVSVHWLEDLEKRADPRAVTVAILTHYADEISRLFPEIVQRAEILRIVPATQPVPPFVQRYIEEASECYVYGRFVACIILCRSAIEFALKDFLDRNGQQKALREMQSLKNDSLRDMINYCKSTFPAMKQVFDDADNIRCEGNRAVHHRAVHLGGPKPESCINTFIKTRGVLGELYNAVIGRNG
jgi:hypothetical protein